MKKEQCSAEILGFKRSKHAPHVLNQKFNVNGHHVWVNVTETMSAADIVAAVASQSAVDAVDHYRYQLSHAMSLMLNCTLNTME